MAGTAARSAKSCGTFVATKVVTRAPSTAVSRRGGRAGAPSNASSSPGGDTSTSSLRSSGASNDWK